MKPPAISVICPCYNGRSFVLRTLQTVAAQSLLPHELIVSDDGSEDGTPEIVREFFAQSRGFATKLLKNSHRGPGAARNAGIKAATGDWLAFLDSDDLWFPSKLAVVSEAIEANPGRNFFCHSEEHHLVDGRKIVATAGFQYRPECALPRQLYRHNLFSTSAVACSRELVMEHGLFDETLMSCQDYELWLRLSPNIRPHFISEPLGVYVYRPGNITSGALMARIRNHLRVLHLHREKVGWWRWLCMSARICLANLRHALFAGW